MRLGVWTPLPHTIPPEPRMNQAIAELGTQGAGTGSDSSYEFAADVLERGERHGFDITLIAARHLGPDLDAWILASALAARTSRTELMVAVHPGINNPQMVAKMAASLDRISGGRVAINVVNGWNIDEFNIFGNGAWLDQPQDRYQRMDEFIEVMKGLWTNDRLTFEGKFYNVDNGHLPLKTRRTTSPPIYAASRSQEGKETIARYCDYWFVPDRGNYRLFDETIALQKAEIASMEDLASQFGRQVRYGMSGHVICAVTLEEAERRATELEAYGRLARYNKSTAAALGACLVGTPQMIAERIRVYESIGIELMMLHFHPMIEGMETFVREVMPLLARPTEPSGMEQVRVAS